mmetsp:Transcript_27071/g.77675  ORF Transcript_27071/g.77675 Transcript_27071/m.77675 type:complete len:244 (-) Transcript_27071:130-861(-)
MHFGLGSDGSSLRARRTSAKADLVSATISRSLGVADASDGLCIVGCVEDCGAGDQGIGACVDELVCVLRADPAVDLDPRVDALGLAHLLQLLDLVHLRLDEALAAEPGVHGHDEDELNVLQDVLDLRERSARVQDHARHAAEVLDLAHHAVQVDGRRRLAVHGDDVGTGLGKVLHALLGLDNHEVAVQKGVRQLLPQRVHDQGADGDVRDKAPVHDVDVDPVRPGLEHVVDLLAELGEVRGEN